MESDFWIGVALRSAWAALHSNSGMNSSKHQIYHNSHLDLNVWQLQVLNLVSSTAGTLQAVWLAHY
jgi:hypothetical protein